MTRNTAFRPHLARLWRTVSRLQRWPRYLTSSALVLGLTSPSFAAMTEAQLSDQLRQRFEGDRTGVCVVAAVVEPGQVVRARYCARNATPLEYNARFEIGSISKTMTAFLVADQIARGKWSLDDPLAQHLPKGSVVPNANGQVIRLRHLLTHTSGLPALPPDFAPSNPLDPYADLSEASLLRSLEKTTLNTAPDSQMQYSNFGMMLLSLAVAQANGNNLGAALQQQLFAPLAMSDSSLALSDTAPQVQGHAPNGVAAPAWTIAPNLAGVGMVRSSLNDMVKYLQAQLYLDATSMHDRLALTQKPLTSQFAMNWAILNEQGHSLLLHEGGTGGFSSLIAFDRKQKRGVVMLADTALTDLGGLGDAALPLLLSHWKLGTPRKALPTPTRWLSELPGDYLMGPSQLPLRISHERKQLKLHVMGQTQHSLGYDSHGDFYLLDAPVSAQLRPLASLTGSGPVNQLQLRQGGGVVDIVRRGSEPPLTANNPIWKDFAGEYLLTPNFSLKVFEAENQLMIQGSGQSAIIAEVTGSDRIEAKSVGAVIEFQRDARGAISHARLLQHGNNLLGQKRNIQ